MKHNLTDVLEEMHLYTDKMDALIKVIIWVISWGGGIYVPHMTANNDNSIFMPSSYFILSLSLLIEFAPKILNKNSVFGRIIHTCFILEIAGLCIYSTFMMIGGTELVGSTGLLYRLSLAIIIWLIIDFIVLWIQEPYKKVVVQDNKIETENEAVEAFREKMYEGNLGSIEKGKKR